MKRRKKHIFWAFLIGIALSLCASINFASDNKVYVIQLDNDTINPVTAEYISKSIDKAEKDNATALVIKLDTPGGLLDSTRTIVKRMLIAKVPIVVYISPSGSRAGSAGVFITYASHVAVMAPSTNIGAAHPVQMGDGKRQEKSEDWSELKELLKDAKKDKAEKKEKSKEETTKPEENFRDDNPMESKILNDTVAFIKSIAKERNRNIEWGVESVTKSSSITADEALAKKVVEFIAKDERDVLYQIDGKTVTIDGKEIILATKDAEIVQVPMDSRQKFFNILANPNIAYILLMLGFYGLLYEITHPGFGGPGIFGAVFLILGFYSMQTLPTNYAGLALIVLGLVLLAAEAFLPGFGMLMIGGLICMILGSMLLFESIDPVMRVSKSLIFAVTITSGCATVFVLKMLFSIRKRPSMSGQEAIIGESGEAQIDIQPGKEGKVFVHGEIWNAVSDHKIKKGEKIKVIEIRQFTLKVESERSST